VRHRFISVALAIGCNQKWIAQQTGTSITMVQEHYGKYIRDDDALQRAYIEASKPGVCSEKTGPFLASYLGSAMGELEQKSGGDGHG